MDFEELELSASCSATNCRAAASSSLDRQIIVGLSSARLLIQACFDSEVLRMYRPYGNSREH